MLTSKMVKGHKPWLLD